MPSLDSFTITKATQGWFILAFFFVQIGLFIRYVIPWTFGELDLFDRVKVFTSWVSVTYAENRWLKLVVNLDFLAAFVCAGIGFARLFIWHI